MTRPSECQFDEFSVLAHARPHRSAAVRGVSPAVVVIGWVPARAAPAFGVRSGASMARVGRARTSGAMMTEKCKLSEQEREQRRARDRERLKDAAEQLLTSEGWQRWVRVRAQGGLARLCLII